MVKHQKKNQDNNLSSMEANRADFAAAGIHLVEESTQEPEASLNFQ